MIMICIKCNNSFERKDDSTRTICRTCCAVIARTNGRSVVQSIPLIQEEKQVIIGTALGDGCFEHNGANYSLSFKHSLKQTHWCLWKANKLKRIQSGDIEYPKDRIRYRSKKTIELTQIATDLFDIKSGRKAVTKALISELDLTSIGVLYLDDGSYDKKENLVRISTCSFTREENELLAARISELFGGIRVGMCKWKNYRDYARPYLGLAMRGQHSEIFREKISLNFGGCGLEYKYAPT